MKTPESRLRGGGEIVLAHDPTGPGRPGPRVARAETQTKRRETGRGWYWLLVLPGIGVVFPWIYNTDSPELFGIPFFYWYQMAWVPISVVITLIVYRATTVRSS
jgi:hypothetical protein